MSAERGWLIQMMPIRTSAAQGTRTSEDMSTHGAYKYAKSPMKLFFDVFIGSSDC